MKVSAVFFNLIKPIIGCVLKSFWWLSGVPNNIVFHVMISFGLQNSLNNLTESYMSSITPGHFRSWSHQSCFLSQRVTTFIVPWICLRALAVTEVHHNMCFQFICHPLSISPSPNKQRCGWETFESEATSLQTGRCFASCVVCNVPFLWSSWLVAA